MSQSGSQSGGGSAQGQGGANQQNQQNGNTNTGGNQQGSGSATTSGTQDRDRIQDRDQIRDPSTHDGTEPDQDRDRIQDRDRLYSSTTSTTTGDQTQDRDRIRDRDRIHVDPENVPNPAQSGSQLRQMIQNRWQALNNQAASSTFNGGQQQMVQNQNQMRLGVYAMLAAQNMLGNLGPQVTNLAKQIDNSVQATVNAEYSIQTRSTLARLFMGGDRGNANAIMQQIAQNQTRIQELSQLINQSGAPSDVKATLQQELQTMTQEQVRLQDVASQQLNMWGIFSWRF